MLFYQGFFFNILFRNTVLLHLSPQSDIKNLKRYMLFLSLKKSHICILKSKSAQNYNWLNLQLMITDAHMLKTELDEDS